MNKQSWEYDSCRDCDRLERESGRLQQRIKLLENAANMALTALNPDLIQINRSFHDFDSTQALLILTEEKLRKALEK
jgi:hypothetical protein